MHPAGFRALLALSTFVAGCGLGMESTVGGGDKDPGGTEEDGGFAGGDGGQDDGGGIEGEGGAGGGGDGGWTGGDGGGTGPDGGSSGDGGGGDGGGGDGGGGDGGGSGDGGGGGDAGSSGDGGGGGAVDADGDGWTTSEGDCDDGDASLSPADDDRDGYSTCAGDCDDSDRWTFPGAAEAESATSCMTDADADGWGDDMPVFGVTAGDDCDDSRPDFAPDAEDEPWDGADQDCDGSDAGTTRTATGDSGLPIRDYMTTISTASLGPCDEIFDLTITVDIEHTYIGDLTVDIVAPTGHYVTLHNRTGSSSRDIVGTYSTSGGSLSAAGSLSYLVGRDGSGDWELWVSDYASLDTGTLNSFSLEVDCP